MTPRIESITLTSGETFALGQVNVLVGPNNVGKSTFLVDLFNKITRRTNERFHWLGDFAVADDTPTITAKAIRNSIEEFSTPNAPHHFQSRSMPFGVSVQAADLRVAPSVVQDIDDAAVGIVRSPEWYTNAPFCHFLFSFASCDQRLLVPPHKAARNSLTSGASDEINALHRDAAKREEVSKLLSALFGLRLFIEVADPIQLEFGLSKLELPAAIRDERDDSIRMRDTYAWMATNVVKAHELSHGVRAALNMCLHLADPLRSTVLIDEPELYLYPARKKKLGRELVELAARLQKQIIVVTHDAAFLQGVLETSQPVTLMRMRFADAAESRTIASWSRTEATEGAQVSATDTLAGLFSRFAVFVEGGSDRLFYGSMLARGDNLDLGLIPLNGLSALRTSGSLFPRIRVPVAAVLDLDALGPGNSGHVTGYLANFGNSSLSERVDEASVMLRTGKNGGEPLSEQTISKRLNRGLASLEDTWSEDVARAVRALVADLKLNGVFLVESGDLESWLSPPIEKDARWAERAVQLLATRPETVTAVLSFFSEIVTYLESIEHDPPGATSS